MSRVLEPARLLRGAPCHAQHHESDQTPKSKYSASGSLGAWCFHAILKRFVGPTEQRILSMDTDQLISRCSAGPGEVKRFFQKRNAGS